MPKIQYINQNDAFLRDAAKLLYEWQKHRGYSDSQIGNIIGCSGRTWARRRADPRDLTIREYWRVVKALKIPYDEAVSAISSGINQ